MENKNKKVIIFGVLGSILTIYALTRTSLTLSALIGFLGFAMIIILIVVFDLIKDEDEKE